MQCSNVRWMVAILVCVSCSVNASSTTKIQHNNGFFVSSSTGYQMPTKLQYGDKTTAFVPGIPSPLPLGDLSGNISSSSLSSPFVQFSGGYTKHYGRYFIAGQLYIIAQDEQEATFYKHKRVLLQGFVPADNIISGNLKQKSFAYGIEVKSGMQLTSKTALAAVLGYGWNPYSLTLISHMGEPVPGSQNTFDVKRSRSYNGRHFITGIEFTYLLQKNLHLNFTYTYNIYPQDKLSFAESGIGGSTEFTSSAHVDGLKTSNALQVGFSYQF